MLVLLALFGNLWVWRIFQANFVLFVLIIASTYLLIISLNQKKLRPVFVLSLFVLLIAQMLTTTRTNLTMLSNDQIRVRDTRLNEYPPLNFPLAHWFEGRSETIAASRIRANFFEQLDPNLYFFAGHPRERVGVDEFERFPYILLPFFVFGVVESVKKHNLIIYLFAFVVVFTSFFGTNNYLGNFTLFSVIAGLTYLGLSNVVLCVAKKQRRLVLLVFVAIYILVFSQTIYYETSA